MSIKTLISPKQLAQAIGASESSLKRWADDGLLRVSKTAGGHRRIPVNDAIRFIRERHLEVIKPEAIGLSSSLIPASECRSIDDLTSMLIDYFTEGKVEEAETLLISSYLSGSSVAEIADGPIQGALEQIGYIWKHKDNGILIEHRATDTCLRSLVRMRSMFHPGENAPYATGGAAPDDPYILPSLIASVVLAENGFKSVNLGPNCPLNTIKQSVEQTNSKITWLTVSVAKNPDQMNSDIMELSDTLKSLGSTLTVGGREASRLGLDPAHITMCNSMSDFERITTMVNATN